MALRFSRLVYEDGIEDLYKGLCGRLIQDGAILLGAAQDLVDFRFLIFGIGGKFFESVSVSVTKIFTVVGGKTSKILGNYRCLTLSSQSIW